MKKLLQEIDTKKKQLDQLRPLPPELLHNLSEWFKVEETYNSNAIEGNTLTRQETALVIEKGLTVSGKSLREHLEATNYALAIDFVRQLVDQKTSEISLADILDIHRLVLKGIDDKNAGRFRTVAVMISGSSVVLPDPIKVFDLMNDFVQWLNTVQDHPVKIAAQAHLKLVTIHPFVDGNGRTARLLMNLILMQHGYPPAVIQVAERLVYITSLEKAQMSGDVVDYYRFIYTSVDRSIQFYLEAARKTI